MRGHRSSFSASSQGVTPERCSNCGVFAEQFIYQQVMSPYKCFYILSVCRLLGNQRIEVDNGHTSDSKSIPIVCYDFGMTANFSYSHLPDQVFAAHPWNILWSAGLTLVQVRAQNNDCLLDAITLMKTCSAI